MATENGEDYEQELAVSCSSQKPDFLIEVYKQSSSHLNRHVTGVWQTVGVVAGALVVVTLDRQREANDFACALVILLCGWLVWTTLDASNWFNRNIAIITNVEKLFLNPEDAKFVHSYFLEHRKPGDLAGHFCIPIALAIAVAIVVLLYHLHGRVLPGLGLPLSQFDWPRMLPFLAAVVVVVGSLLQYSSLKTKDRRFKERSPGRLMRTP